MRFHEVVIVCICVRNKDIWGLVISSCVLCHRTLTFEISVYISTSRTCACILLRLLFLTEFLTSCLLCYPCPLYRWFSLRKKTFITKHPISKDLLAFSSILSFPSSFLPVPTCINHLQQWVWGWTTHIQAMCIFQQMFIFGKCFLPTLSK